MRFLRDAAIYFGIIAANMVLWSGIAALTGYGLPDSGWFLWWLR